MSVVVVVVVVVVVIVVVVIVVIVVIVVEVVVNVVVVEVVIVVAVVLFVVADAFEQWRHRRLLSGLFLVLSSMYNPSFLPLPGSLLGFQIPASWCQTSNTNICQSPSSEVFASFLVRVTPTLSLHQSQMVP